VLPICNLPRAAKIPQTEPRSAFIPSKKHNPPKSPRPSPRSPRATRGERIQRWRPRNRRMMGRRSRRRSRHPGSGHIVSAPSTILIGLFPRGCSKTRILSIGAAHSVNLSPWKMLKKSSHFTILPNGVWPSPLVLFFMAFFTITGWSSITSTRTPFATFPSLFTFVKHFSELNPTRIFSASSSESNHNPPRKILLLWGALASN
jgi:hypothetical protein